MSVIVSDLILRIPSAERSAFKTKVEGIASRLGVPYIHLMAIMDLESAHTFDPSIKNSRGYVGLIQFGDAAAKDLGTTTAVLQKMTRLQQLDYVEKYFNLWKKRLGITKFNDFVDLYLVVFYPAGVKETDPNKPFSPANVELANPKLIDANGHITKNSIRAAYMKDYAGLYEQIADIGNKAVDFTKKNLGILLVGLLISAVWIILAYEFLWQGRTSVSLGIG
jgi:hypothetical protein